MQLSVPHEAVSELGDLLPQQVGPSVPEVRGHLMMMRWLLSLLLRFSSSPRCLV